MITFRDKTEFDKKIVGFTRQNTRLVADFDGTLINPGKTSWCVFRDILGEQYTQAADRLADIFRHYEANPDLLSHDRRKKMVKAWWQSHFNLFRRLPLTQGNLTPELIISQLILREGIWDMMRGFEASGIPIIVFSGGISQVIDMILQREMPNSSAHVLANRLGFCTEGKSTGVVGPIIHTLNKTEGDIGGLPESISSRTQTIILGDSLSDRHMVTTADSDMVSVGFLTTPKLSQREAFYGHFDIVVESNTCDGGIGRILLEGVLNR